MSRKPNHTFDSSNTRHNIARILGALKTPQTYKQLRETLFMSERSLQHYISHLRAEPNRRVRVDHFLFLNCRWVPVLALGSEPDAVKPRQTEKERNAKYRAKVKATPEKNDARKRRNQARWIVQKAKKRQVTWLSALIIGRQSASKNIGSHA